ncbi:hypothetical protein [Neorhodopirellula lusitana]
MDGLNPYTPAKEPSLLSHDARRTWGKAMRWVISIAGFALYCSTPWRDAAYFRDIAANEGFGTTADSYAIGIAGSFLSTVMYSPIALLLIGYGIFGSPRIALLPKRPQSFSMWAIFATIVFGMMIVCEIGYIDSAVRFRHHQDTGVWSLACIAFMYVWWCCSLNHSVDAELG